MAVVQGGESGKQDVGGKQTGSYAQGRSHQSDGSVLLEVDGAGDSPVLDRVSMPPEDSAAVNLRDVHTAAPDILKPGVLWRSSQLVGADQLSKLGLKVCCCAIMHSDRLLGLTVCKPLGMLARHT